MEFEGTDNAVSESPAEEPTSLDTAPAPETEGGEPQGSDTEGQEQQLDEHGNPIPQPEEQTDFEWEGESYKLPKKLAESLRDGTLMRADHTRKTQEIADQRRELAGEHARLVQQAQAMKAGAEGISRLDAANNTLVQLDAALTQALEAGDSIRATAIQRDMRKWEGHRAEVQQWLGAVQQTVVSQNDAATRQRWEETNSRLTKEIPGWEKGELNAKISEWAIKQGGFTPESVRNITAYPVVKALYKAYLYDQSQSAKKPAAPQRPTPQPTRQIAAGQTAPASRGSLADLAKKSDPTDFIRQRRAMRAKEEARG